MSVYYLHSSQKRVPSFCCASYKFILFSHPNSSFLVLSLTPMPPRNDVAPTYPPMPPGVMEYFAMLVQNGSLPVPTPQPSIPLVAPLSLVPNPTPPTETRSFTRPGRGQGGALAEKEKASKDVTASATKRKSLVDPDIETPPATTSGKTPNTKMRVKRIKVSAVRSSF
jgi:hypothetical protein